ncbi:MAG: type I methionyl aminopeptidase [Alphaproteobacteria bacterium]|nr:type I methionyl aminopeptidase [Alphaproteobacteria bacterium]MDD9919845.1 type I methionyl aminopeptidase [Alphaproteobacteria bacterium]
MKPKPKNSVELTKMRAAGQLAAQVLDFITPHVEVGTNTLKLNDLCHDFILKHNATPAPLNYKGFPKSICTSINDVVCHGIPSEKDILKDGDIVNIDVTVILDGYHGDTSRMYLVGNVSDEARKLVDDTYEAMMIGINTIKSGSYLSEVGKAIQEYSDKRCYGVVRDFCGHGLGKVFHESPPVLHYYPQIGCEDFRLRKGTTFTVEPMINLGTWEAETMEDGWTARTKDRKLSAQFEHTLAVTEDGVETFTESPKGWHKPPYA